MLFAGRFHAGRELGSKLGEFRNRKDTVVLALPSGGVPVAYEAAKSIHAPLCWCTKLQ
jgi:predicted phosphoribosyltransferase